MSFSNPEVSFEKPDKKINAVHDLFFRKSMSNPMVALEFFETHLPEEIFAQLDLSSLQVTQESFIDGELCEHITDLLYQASFQGNTGYVYLLVEHQRMPDALMAFRLVEYMVKIARMHLEKGNSKLPIIYPCVIYNGMIAYRHATDIFSLCEDQELMRKIILEGFQLIDLSQFSDDDLKKKPLLGIVEILLKHAFTRDLVTCIRQLEELLQIADKNNEWDFLKSALSFLIHTQEDKKTVVTTFKEILSPQSTSKIMTIAEQLIEEGLQKGRQEGRRDALRVLLEKQIQRRFSFPAKKYFQQISKADSDTLSLWIEKLMDAKTVDEVFA